MTGQDLTKARLLEAAGEEFAEKGFDAARVRSICRKADANLAAVNYHFGDKEQLYRAALLEAHRCGTKIPSDSAFADGSPAEQLRRYIDQFLGNVLENRAEGSRWHYALMVREMLQPTSALEFIVRESIRPRFERLESILRAICPEAEERRIHALAFSVIGQCLHYKMAAPVSERLIGTETYQTLDHAFLTDHIAGFCLAALGLAPPCNEAGQTADSDAVSVR
jgi:AcrR family transcriptional regulator